MLELQPAIGERDYFGGDMHLHGCHSSMGTKIVESPPRAVYRASDHAGREHDMEGLRLVSTMSGQLDNIDLGEAIPQQ